MKLSIMVNTKNRDYAIGLCLDSIATAITAASPIDPEIVVVDNGSTDNTNRIIQAWAAANATPLQLLFEPKAGLARAQNRAIRSARRGVLAFTFGPGSYIY